VQFVKSYWGIFVVPVLALAYGSYALWELTTGPFQDATKIYTYMIAIPMLILGAIGVAGDMRKPSEATEAGAGDSDSEADDGTVAGGVRRVTLVVLVSLALILALPWVGYLVGFFIYVLAVLWAVGLKNWVASVIIAVVMVAVVQIVFVGLLGQDLPVGFLTFMER